MKFLEIFRFELRQQLRSALTWVYFGIAFLFPLFFTFMGEPTDDAIFLNAPSFLILITIFVNVIFLLMTGAIAGHAAARDVQTGMHPLIYTAPVSKLQYLGGRFLAAFLLNALIHLFVPIVFVLSFTFRTIDPALIGPFRIEAYLTTYVYLSLPMAFVATAFQFSAAVLDRRAITAFMISVLIFPITSVFIGTMVAKALDNWDLWKLMDVVGVSLEPAMNTWTTFEKNTRLIELEGIFLWNRVMWFSISTAVLTYTYVHFQFKHHADSSGRILFFFRRRKRNARSLNKDESSTGTGWFAPQIERAFGFKTHLRQFRAIAWQSFQMIAKSKVGLTVVGLFALQLFIFGQEYMMFRGVPQYPTTMNTLTVLTASLKNFQTALIIIPMLIIFFAGELVWREREVGLNKISDVTPVSEWAIMLGKFSGLALVISVWLGFLMIGGILAQLSAGYTKFEIDVYLKALFGFQLITYLLFAMLALAVHVFVNQKYLAHCIILILYLCIAFAGKFGVNHNLLIYASDPGWSYTDMRGFEPNFIPWLSFKLYWVGWAVLLAVAAKLFWVRSMSEDVRTRMILFRARFSRASVAPIVIALIIVMISGGYVFYNTNILNDYVTASEHIGQQVNYEKLYRKYKDIPQPLLTGTKVRVELYPSQRKAQIAGTYRLINKSKTAIDTIHLSAQERVETTEIKFDRPFKVISEDKELGYRIYTLENALQPGDSLNLMFEVHYQATGFTNTGIDASVIENGTYFINYEWLPAVGYQQNRELRDNAVRTKYGLNAWAIPSLYDSTANRIMPGQELIAFEAIIGTEKDQLAVTAGKQLRLWRENGRNYFQYAVSAPIRNNYSFFSARYALRKSNWNHVAIQVYYHPEHTENIDRIVESVQDALNYYTEKFGPYPYHHLSIIERSGFAGALNAEPTTIDYGESFTLSNQENNSWALDITSFAIAHEVAHQWWGAAQVIPAHVEGAIVISETLANYSALKVMEEKYGVEHGRKLLSMWRDSYEVPRERTGSSLLQATDAFLGYLKGPLAMHALTRYADNDAVNNALRRLCSRHNSGKPPFPTSLDLYQGLNAAIPDSLHYLSRDYFERNIYWQLKTKQTQARKTNSGEWEVTLDIQAKKITVDSTGAEISIPMNDWIEIGIFAPWQEGDKVEKELYLQKHRIVTGDQTITITIPEKPGRAGIDPYYLLIDLDLDNNSKPVNIEGKKDSEPDFI